MTSGHFQQKFEVFARQLSEQIDRANIELQPHWQIDHVCYRVESHARYMELKNAFQGMGRLLIESEVNGRPIATFKLFKPLYFRGRRIDLVELLAPKSGKNVAEGFEHLEVVCDETFAHLREKYKNLPLDENGLKKTFNPELEVELNDLAIKFHHLSLESVVTLEGQEPVVRALNKSQVLERFREGNPLVAGTFPLGIAGPHSDIDILLTSANFEQIEKQMRGHYGKCEGFEVVHKRYQDLSSLSVRFQIDGVPFEVFVQEVESVRQRGYRHFQVEERLLKLGGDAFRRNVMDLRAQGLKTEPAFAEALKLEASAVPGRDAYEKLEELHGWPEARLQDLLAPVVTMS